MANIAIHYMRLGNFEIELVKFTPKQVEEITGLSTIRQRDLRRHGYLPSNQGHARFDVVELTEIYVLQLMLERNIGPKKAKEISEICALGVTWAIFGSDNAYGKDYDLISGIHALNEMVAKEIEDDKPGFFRSHIFRPSRIKKLVPDEFFIWWANEQYSWYTSLERAFEDVDEHDSKRTGPIIILSLSSLASDLKRKAGSVFAKVKILEAES